MFFEEGDLAFGRYPAQIDKCLEKNTMSKLYLGKLYGTEVKVLIKVQKYDFLLREFEMLNTLRHPGILRVLDFVVAGKYAYMVMPYYEGDNLERVISQCGAMEEENVLHIAKELCEILVFLQERDKPVLHNDLKPSNILLKEDGSIILLDFGIASLEGAKREDVLFQGTLGYAAPECWHQERCDLSKATDVFAFGATIFRLLENKQPKDCYGKFVLTDCERRERWQPIINKCCTLEAKYRYQNAAQLSDALYHIKIR